MNITVHWYKNRKGYCMRWNSTSRLFYTRFGTHRVPTVLEKFLNFRFSLKSPWKWICPWKVLEFRGPSLKFQLVVLDFLFYVLWTESLKGYSKLRGTRANSPPPPKEKKKPAGFARSSLQVKYFSSSSCSYIILEQLLSYPSFPKNTYRYLCMCFNVIICFKMGSLYSYCDIITKLVYPPELSRIAGFCANSNKNFLGEGPQTLISSRIVWGCIITIIQQII